VTTTDYEAPSWPVDATLDVSNLTESSVTLSWTALDAAIPVASYQLTQDDQPIQTVDAATTSVDVKGLSAGTAYTFKVEAVGPTDQKSTDGPSAAVTTLDTSEPTWPANSKLTAVKVGGTTVDLSWTAAIDNVGIASYKVLQDGKEAATVDGKTTTAAISGLSISTGYTFQVLAADGADQWTENGPTAAVTTTSGQEALTNQEVFDGLKSQCVACHSGGVSNPFFMKSLDNFNTLLVQDEELVVPGDPDASLVIQLMEGKGSGGFVQMPTFGDSFKVASDKGKTDITIEEVRYWIQTMEAK
jgi:chitodextrinase